MQFAVSVALMLAGMSFIVIAALGIVRMPDLFTRMSASTKAATLGIGLLLTATAVHFNDVTVTSRVVATIVFLLLTSPVAAHSIGRAAYTAGIPLWQRTLFDELRGAHASAAARPMENTLNGPDSLQANNQSSPPTHELESN